MDKKKAEEKQELAKLFAKNVNEAIHIISEKQGWKDGSPEKIALHSFFAGIEGELSGNGFMSGALAGGVNEAAVAKLMKVLGPNNPDLVQMASAALGYATNKLAGEDALAGAALAQWGTKWNNDSEDFILNVVGNALSTALEEKVIITLDEVVEIAGKKYYKFIRESGAVGWVGVAQHVYENSKEYSIWDVRNSAFLSIAIVGTTMVLTPRAETITEKVSWGTVSGVVADMTIEKVEGIFFKRLSPEEKSRIDSEQINKAIEELREGIYVVD